MNTNKKIFVTGASGFIGSNLCRDLVEMGYSIIALKRKDSNLEKCHEFEDALTWVLDGNSDWEKNVLDFRPNVIIHCAWGGVMAEERDNWEIQSKNLFLVYKLLEIGRKTKIKKFIGLGSQAEYGIIDGKVSEHQKVRPNNAYGAMKFATSKLIEHGCRDNNIHWYWLRLFSFFGENESDNWLIPSSIKRMLIDKEMNFTPGEQKYAYLYIKDLCHAIISVISHNSDKSGIYNLSSNHPVSIKDIITFIRDAVNPDFQLNFGALPYRPNQPMHIEGDISAFENSFGKIDTANFYQKLGKVISSLKNKYKVHED